MRSRFRSEQGPNASREGRPLELVRVRGTQRNAGHEGRDVRGRGRRRGTRGRSRGTRPGAPPPPRPTFWGWLRGLFGAPAPAAAPPARSPRSAQSLGEQEAKAFAEFSRHFGITFRDPDLLKLALTHRSYLSVSGQDAIDSNERLEFLGDSVLGLVTSEFLYRQYPGEHEGQLTKTKSLLVSKAILSRRALAMGLGRFVLMSHSEVESGGRQRLSIIADAFEGVVGAIYLDQGFEAARAFIERWLLRETKEITSDRRHTNYKSHLQEYVQSNFHTHPVYRIRSEMGPDHSKQFMVEVMVGRRTLGEGKGRNKKEAEQAAARDAIERAEKAEGRSGRERRDAPSEAAHAVVTDRPATPVVPRDLEEDADAEDAPRRRGRRGGRGRRSRSEGAGGEVVATPPVADAGDIVPRHSTIERAPEGGEPAPASARRSGSQGIPVALPPEDGRFERLRQEVMGDDQQDVEVIEVEPAPHEADEDDFEEIGRPEGPHEDRRVDVYAVESDDVSGGRSWTAPRELATFDGSRGPRKERRAREAADDPGFEMTASEIEPDEADTRTDDEEAVAGVADENLEPADDAAALPPRFDPEVPVTPPPPPVVREPSPPSYGRRSSRGRRGPSGR